jgi:hypothetical protein
MTTPKVPTRAGFTLVEVLIIAILVLVVMLSLVPLFSQSMMSNLEGWTATEGIAFGRTELEDKSALGLDRADMVVPGGSSQMLRERAWDPEEHEWVDPANAPDLLIWQRDTRVRLFSVSDLTGSASEEKRFGNPLDGAIDPRYVHFREINVWVEHQKGADTPGASRGLDVTVLRSY